VRMLFTRVGRMGVAPTGIGSSKKRARQARAASCLLKSLASLALIGATVARVWAQGEEPPELALPRVVVVGVDTLRIDGVKADLPVLQATSLRPLVVHRSAAAPAAAVTAVAAGSSPSFLFSVVGGGARTFDWRVGAEGRVGETHWSARARRAASHDSNWGRGAWWEEEVVASGGGELGAGVRWGRLGYRSRDDGSHRVTVARPWVEWRGAAHLRAGWAGASREDAWRDVLWVDAEAPLHRRLLLRAEGRTRAGIAACANGQLESGRWSLAIGLGSLVRDDGDVEWLAEARGLLGLERASTVWIAGRRRAVFHDPYSLLSDAPYTSGAGDGWTWAELREEGELGVMLSRGPLDGSVTAGVWRGKDHPQWESEQHCVPVKAEGGVLGLLLRWRAGIFEGEGSVARLFSDVVGQERALDYTPVYRWSTRLGVRLGRGEFAAQADGAGSRSSQGADLDAFARAGFEARVRFNENVSLTIQGANLLGEEYELWEGYPMPGARIVAGLEVNL
jgi:hypothetical protein